MQFILRSGSATFDDNDVENALNDKFYDMFWGENVLDFLYIDVIRCFGSRKYGILIMRKSYIADQITHFSGKKK